MGGWSLTRDHFDIGNGLVLLRFAITMFDVFERAHLQNNPTTPLPRVAFSLRLLAE